MSDILRAAFAAWRECRDAYQLHLEAQIAAADEQCRGNLLNRRGIVRGIASASLFLGPLSRAQAYASDELLDFWTKHPRLTYAAFERMWHHDGM